MLNRVCQRDRVLPPFTCWMIKDIMVVLVYRTETDWHYLVQFLVLQARELCLYGAHLKHKESRDWGKKKDFTCESMHSGEKHIVNFKSKI